MDDCIFCKIVSGQIPSFKIYEDTEFMAILDISRFVEGHTIVIPKKHYEVIWDFEDQHVAKYWQVILKIGNHFRQNLGIKYVDTMTFGRLVRHTHVHLVPHNDDNPEWQNALEQIGNLQHDSARRLTVEAGEKLQKKYRVKE